MRRDVRFPRKGDDRRMMEMDGAILRSLDRFTGQLIQTTWQELATSFGAEEEPLDYSGIHPIGSQSLLPFLQSPGVFLVFGPLPELRILHLGASQTRMYTSLTSKLLPGPEWSWGWRWDSSSTPIPTYAACVSMDRNWTMVPALETLLGHYLAPLQAAHPGDEEEEPFT